MGGETSAGGRVAREGEKENPLPCHLKGVNSTELLLPREVTMQADWRTSLFPSLPALLPTSQLSQLCPKGGWGASPGRLMGWGEGMLSQGKGGRSGGGSKGWGGGCDSG